MIVILLLITVISCKKTLDITPNGRITLKEVFQDEKRTEAFLNTVYGQIPGYFYSYNFYGFLSVVSDEAQESYIANSESWINGGLTPSSNGLNNFYARYWAGIRYANEFLANIDLANVSNAANKNRFKAEAKVLRAYYYWELIKQYGPMPILDRPLEASYDFTTLKRPAFQDNIDFIIKDCDDAIANSDLPMRIIREGEIGRMTKAVAYAIKSEALLFNASSLWNPNNDVAKWQTAAIASKEAQAALTANGDYELASDYGDYFQLPSDGGSSPRDKETILERPGEAGIHLVIENGIPSKSGTNKAGACPTQELVDSYEMQASGEPAILEYEDNDHLNPIINTLSGYDPNNPYLGRDPRFYATVWFNGAQYDNGNGNVHTMETFVGGADQWVVRSDNNKVNTHTGYYLRKFIDPQLQIGQPSSATWKIYRLAEIYLNFAEAENEANGPNTNAYFAINTVRNRAGMPDLPLGLTKDKFRERVHNERRVEFAFEEKRFWDVRRWKILDKTDNLVTAMVIAKNSDNTFTYNRVVTERRDAWQSKYLIYPIPLGDVSDIPDFSTNQNPGW